MGYGRFVYVLDSSKEEPVKIPLDSEVVNFFKDHRQEGFWHNLPLYVRNGLKINMEEFYNNHRLKLLHQA